MKGIHLILAVRLAIYKKYKIVGFGLLIFVK